LEFIFVYGDLLIITFCLANLSVKTKQQTNIYNLCLPVIFDKVSCDSEMFIFILKYQYLLSCLEVKHLKYAVRSPGVQSKCCPGF